MALIPFTVLTSEGVDASIMLCSERRYEEYMKKGLHKIFPYAVHANFFKEYLKNNHVSFEDVPETVLVWDDIIGNDIQIWKDAVCIDLFDIKTILELNKLQFADFVDKYAEHLKTI